MIPLKNKGGLFWISNWTNIYPFNNAVNIYLKSQKIIFEYLEIDITMLLFVLFLKT